MSRVMVVGPLDADSFADNLVNTLDSMGHETLAAGPARPRLRGRRANNLWGIAAERMPRQDALVQRKLLRSAEQFSPDLIISVDRTLSTPVLRGMRSLGARTALWFPDHVSNLGRHDVFVAGYDRLFFKNPLLVDQLRDIHGLPAHYLPEGANDKWHVPRVPYGSRDALVMVGNVHPTRALLIQRLVNAGVPVRIYGPPFGEWTGNSAVRGAHEGHQVTRAEKADVFRSAVAVLNNLHPAEFAGANCRLFEATASGGVVLTERRPGMSELFDFGSEVVPFSTFEQLVDLYAGLREDPARATGIADAAARRSAAEHTWRHRLDNLMAAM